MWIVKVLLVSLLFVAGTRSQALWKALVDSKEPIDKFRSLIESTDQKSILMLTNCTIFIPTNEALARRYPDGVDKLKAEDKRALVLMHIGLVRNKDGANIRCDTRSVFKNPNVKKMGKNINFSNGISMGKFIKVYTQQGDVILYLTEKVNGTILTYYVNNALLKPQTAANLVTWGSYHVITDVISPNPRSLSVDQFIAASPSDFSTFREIYVTFKAQAKNSLLKSAIVAAYENSNSNIIASSFFIPDNVALSAVPTAEMTKLKSNVSMMEKFLVSHVAHNQIVFISWMRNKPPINLKMEIPIDTVDTGKYQSFDGKMYSDNNGTSNYISVGGVTAAIRSEAQPLKNAVMMRITKPLNFLYMDVTQIMTDNNNEFKTKCVANAKCSQALKSGNVTVFLPPATFTFPNLNATQMEKFLLLHVIPNRRISTPEMTNGLKIEIPDVGVVRFHPGDKEEMTVAGRFLYKAGKNGYDQGYVGARVKTPNLAGFDGIVHVLQGPLGYTTRSIYQLLENKLAIYSKLVRFLNVFDLKKNLEAPPADGQFYTFFAPTNAAFDKMTDKIGKQILSDDDQLNKLFKRLLLLNVVVVSNLEVGKDYSADTALPYENQVNERAQLKIRPEINRMQRLQTYVSDEAATVSIYPDESEWGCTNGIVYELNEVPYNAKSVDSVCKPGTTCGAPSWSRGLGGTFMMLLLSAAAAMVLHIN